MTTESHVVIISGGARPKPWGQFTCAALAEDAARKLKMIGMDARVVPGRVIDGELVLFAPEPTR